jgi:energy-coupling factor transporter transmembrane protein EcfT
MMTEVVGNFPVPKFLYIPFGFALMVIVVLATHLVTTLSAELCFNWKQYAKPYKIMLPLTNLLLLFFCWAIQSEGGAIETKKDYSLEIAKLETDTTSGNMRQIEQSIADVRLQLKQLSSTISNFDSLRESRRSKWLNKHENQIYLNAQQTKQSLSVQLVKLTQNRIAELNTIRKEHEIKITELKQEKEYQIQKGKGRAGLAESLLVFTAFFMMAYKQRFRTHTVETQDLIQEVPQNLSVEERERMVKQMEIIGFDEENFHLVFNYNSQKFYFLIPTVIQRLRSLRSKFEKTAKSSRSKETQLKNIAVYEMVLRFTEMETQDLERVYNYQPLNLDYWESTSENGFEIFSKRLQNRSKTDSNLSITATRDLFE